MDIDNTGSPAIPEIVYPAVVSDKPVPSDRKCRLSCIKPSINTYPEQEHGDVRDKITISPEARRRFRKMMNLMHRYHGKTTRRGLPYIVQGNQ